jgi:hypothetical protein
VRITKAMEDEVNGSLGALLGMLEVLAIDVQEPLSERQRAFVADALRMGDSVRAAVEALLTLLSDEADPRFGKSGYALRRLVDHAVRAAGWSASDRQVTLTLPESGDWESEPLWLEPGRVDRCLRAMTDALVAAVAPGGVVELRLEPSPRSFALILSATPAAGQEARLHVPQLVRSAWQRLIALQAGQLSMDVERLSLRLELPRAVAEESR